MATTGSPQLAVGSVAMKQKPCRVSPPRQSRDCRNADLRVTLRQAQGDFGEVLGRCPHLPRERGAYGPTPRMLEVNIYELEQVYTKID